MQQVSFFHYFFVFNGFWKIPQRQRVNSLCSQIDSDLEYPLRCPAAIVNGCAVDVDHDVLAIFLSIHSFFPVCYPAISSFLPLVANVAILENSKNRSSLAVFNLKWGTRKKRRCHCLSYQLIASLHL